MQRTLWGSHWHLFWNAHGLPMAKENSLKCWLTHQFRELIPVLFVLLRKQNTIPRSLGNVFYFFYFLRKCGPTELWMKISNQHADSYRHYYLTGGKTRAQVSFLGSQWVTTETEGGSWAIPQYPSVGAHTTWSQRAATPWKGVGVDHLQCSSFHHCLRGTLVPAARLDTVTVLLQEPATVCQRQPPFWGSGAFCLPLPRPSKWHSALTSQVGLPARSEHGN